ncbi:hypothetical protein [Motiliproteus sp. MSK22-1]|uniref:hypothetical protein n=1 Tax=Motiliproteus sp. MSK22-1 TaxID=1897630 RepID=UPI0009FA4A04|nr:hypothetical protein [Motiliproteus sp. MSK22-1]
MKVSAVQKYKISLSLLMIAAVATIDYASARSYESGTLKNNYGHKKQIEVSDSNSDWDDGWTDDSWDNQDSRFWKWSGYTELAFGYRLQEDPLIGDSRNSLGELRQQIELTHSAIVWQFSAKADLIADSVTEEFELDLRKAEFAWSPSPAWDLKLGSQVLTWGTGQYLFVNDLFPKDWQSFFAGRDDEYLKAPAIALKASYFSHRFNLDLVWLPEFTSDRYITGERFSFFSPDTNMQVAPEPHFDADEPDNSELAIRLFKTFDTIEAAIYGYRGYWKTPSGLDQVGTAYHPRLNVVGASLRGPVSRGIGNVEMAWYDSKEEPGGNTARTPTNQFRLLLGYEQEIAARLTAAGQFYLEWLQDYEQLEQPRPSLYNSDEYRQVLTFSLRYRTLQDRLILHWFSFYSPSDRDYFLKPSAHYRINDHWQLTAGLNIFGGDSPHTTFAQMEKSSNSYVRVRYQY